MTTSVTSPVTAPVTGMRYYRHRDGLVCWTYPTDTSVLHWRAPRAGERSGTVHCGRRHDNPALLDELTEADARVLLSACNGRAALVERVRSVLTEQVTVPAPTAHANVPGESAPSLLAVAVQVADALLLDGYRRTDS